VLTTTPRRHCLITQRQTLQHNKFISVVNKDLSFKAKANDLMSEHVQGPL